jgi:hypothetical protein
VSCKAFGDMAEAHVLGLLEAQEAKRFEQHLQICPECAQQVSALRDAAHLLQRGFNQEPPAYLRAKVLNALKQNRSPKSNWLFWAAPGLLGVAAVVLFIKIEPSWVIKRELEVTPAVGEKLAQAVPVLQKARTAIKEMRSPKSGPSFETMQPLGKKNATDGSVAAANKDQASQVAQSFLLNRAATETAPEAEEKISILASVNGGGDSLEAKAASSKEALRFSKRLASQPSAFESSENFAARAPEGQALLRVQEQNYRALSAEALTSGQNKTLSCSVSLVSIQGGADRAQVRFAVERLEQELRARIVLQGEVRTVFIRADFDQKGNVVSASYTSPAFESAEVNSFVLEKIRSIKLSQSAAPSSAAILIKIEVKPF